MDNVEMEEWIKALRSDLNIVIGEMVKLKEEVATNRLLISRLMESQNQSPSQSDPDAHSKSS